MCRTFSWSRQRFSAVVDFPAAPSQTGQLSAQVVDGLFRMCAVFSCKARYESGGEALASAVCGCRRGFPTDRGAAIIARSEGPPQRAGPMSPSFSAASFSLSAPEGRSGARAWALRGSSRRTPRAPWTGTTKEGSNSMSTPSEKDRVVIFDTTLRDGEQSPGATMTHEEKLEVAELLDQMGVDVIEAGFPIASEGDFHAVHEIAERAQK